MRITKITGEMNGAEFEVKPTPINFNKIDDQKRDMLRDWYKENHPKLYKKISDDKMTIEDYTGEDLVAMQSWLEDVEFRAKYLKFMADKCMKFRKEPSASIWKSDDLEYGTIEEAWDFFTKRRSV